MKRDSEKAMFAQKKTGLNKVTVKKVGDKYQTLLNGRGVFQPSTRATALKHLKALKIDAEHHDKSGHKLNQKS